MKKTLVQILKFLILLTVLALVGRAIYAAWHDLGDKHVAIDWRFVPAALIGFCGVMLTSSLVWRWLATRMGDHSPLVPLLGAYTFSQMGKYIPGKVALLLMRINRAKRFGMTGSICTLSTLLENALYMISGGLVGVVGIWSVVAELNPRYRAIIWPATFAAVAILAGACHPKIFYSLVGSLMKKMKRPPIAPEQ